MTEEHLTEREREMLNGERNDYNRSQRNYWAYFIDRHDSIYRFLMILFGVLLPIGAFLTNLYFIPFPVCFYSPELYTALFIGFIGITITALWKGPCPKLLILFTVHATFLGVVYSSVFSLGFLPLIPISAIAIIFYGLGILGFSPFLSLWVFIVAFRRNFTMAKEFYNKTLLIVSCIIITIILPLLYCGVRTGMSYVTRREIYRAVNCKEEEKPAIYKSLLKQPGIKTALVNIYAYNETPFDTLAGYLMPKQDNYSKYIYGDQAATLYYLLYGEKIQIAEKETLKKIRIGYRNMRSFHDYMDEDYYYSGVYLTGCHYDGVVNLDSMLSYQEITLDVASKWNKQEMTCEFRVPPGGAVTKLSLWINGEEHIASVAAKEKAETAYNSIVSKQRDPAIVTWLGGNLYSLKVFPVETNLPRKVKIGISSPLCPGEKGMSFQPVMFHTRNFSMDKKAKTSAIIDVRSKGEMFSVNGTSKDMKISSMGRYEKRAEIAIDGFRSDDFELLIEKTGQQSDILSYSSKNFTCYQIPFYPSFRNMKSEPVSVTYFLDCTAQMEKDGVFKGAKEAIIKSINNLGSDDRFNVIAANFENKNLCPSPVSVTEENRKKASEFINGLEAYGGMDIVPALDRSFFPENYDLKPVFLGIVHSGHPLITYGQYCIEKAERYEGLSAGVIVINYDDNSFVTDLVQQVNGLSLRVNVPENLAGAFSKVETCALQGGKYNITCKCITSDKSVIPVPSSKIDITPASPAFFYVRLPKGYKQDISVIIKEEDTGHILRKVNLKKEHREVSDEHIGRLWAFNYLVEARKREIGNKLSDEEFSETVKLAKDYYMVSPYTALIVLETQEQYKQFGIDRNYNGEMTAPSIPEPETVFMIIVMILIAIVIYYRSGKVVTRDA
ncbi:MAG: VIT domain-containing protein [Candidatus Eremiobacterota bacterium]